MLAPQACRSVFLKFDLEFDLKNRKLRWENLVKFGGNDFSTCQERTENFRREFRGKFRGKFGGKFRKLRFKFRDFFLETSLSRRAVLTLCEGHNRGNLPLGGVPRALCGSRALRGSPGFCRCPRNFPRVVTLCFCGETFRG